MIRYAIINRSKAIDYGISTFANRVKDDRIIINESEVINNVALEGTYDERIEKLDGKSYNETEIFNIINEGGWNYDRI